MLLPSLLLILSLFLLYWGAEFLVRGSSSLALRLGVTSLIVGLTVVAFGTSAPELIVSVQSAINGLSAIAIGNVVGSNIFNICIILGLSAVIYPLRVSRQLLRMDMWIMLGVTLLFTLFFMDGHLSRLTGIFFFAGIIIYTLVCIYKAKKDPQPTETGIKPIKKIWVDILLIIGGLIILVWGSDMLVDNAITIAQALGWSEAVIGLTIVAAGTSMPELATSLVAAIKKRTDIAIGNIVGSNIFNILAVLGATATISPIRTQDFNTLDFAMMAGSSALLLLFMYTGFKISRWEGAILFLIYIGYLLFLL